MKPGDVYTRYDDKEYIWHWWEMDEYKNLLSVIPIYNGVNPNWYIEASKYQLIKAIYDTGVKCNRIGWYWDITKQNLIDIKREYNLWQNNLNNNRFTDNNHQYNNRKINNNSNCRTNNAIDNGYIGVHKQQKQYNNTRIIEQTKMKLQQIQNEMLQRQEINQRLQNDMRKDMKQYIDKMLEEFERINGVIQNYNHFLANEDVNSLDYGMVRNKSINSRNISNNNLTSNMNTNIHNQNNNRMRNYDNQNNDRLTNNNNDNNQIQQSRNHSYDDRGINNKINFDNSWIEQAEYKDLVKAIKKYSKMKLDDVDSYYEKQFVKVLQNERVSCDKMGWWFDINGDKFAKIKKAYDLLHNRRVVNNRYNANNHQYNKKCKKYMADCETHGVDGGNQIIAYNLNHRMSKQYCNDSINRKNAAGYTMGLYTTNINGINDSIHV